MPRTDTRSSFAGPGVMLFSAAVFGYFGFFHGIVWNSPGAGGQPVLFWAILEWALKGAAIAFIGCAILFLLNAVAANAAYAAIGLVCAAAFVVVAVMDYVDKQNGNVIPPIVLLLFAAWNGYWSWHGLCAVLAVHRRRVSLPDTDD